MSKRGLQTEDLKANGQRNGSEIFLSETRPHIGLIKPGFYKMSLKGLRPSMVLLALVFDEGRPLHPEPRN